MRIVIDAMGGDHAPEAVVKGAMIAAKAHKDLTVVLVGDEAKIKPYLTSAERVEIIHTTTVISGDDEPVKAVRRKKDASLVLMANEVKEQRADACISAGNTGALMSAGLFQVGRIKGIERPALSPTLPTIDQKGFVLLDVGANVEAKPKHLLQYGIMGSIYAEKVRGIKQPRVGLLNVGTEDNKGTELTKEAFQLLKQAPINFVGNVEARDLLSSVADVVVTDGFSGNIALKTKLAAAVLKKDLKGLKDQLDYAEYGGAALFGLKSPVVKAHGSSNDRAIYSAIKQTMTMVEHRVSETIADTVQSMHDAEVSE